jgi:hypothetical protein
MFGQVNFYVFDTMGVYSQGKSVTGSKFLVDRIVSLPIGELESNISRSHESSVNTTASLML